MRRVFVQILLCVAAGWLQFPATQQPPSQQPPGQQQDAKDGYDKDMADDLAADAEPDEGPDIPPSFDGIYPGGPFDIEVFCAMHPEDAMCVEWRGTTPPPTGLPEVQPEDVIPIKGDSAPPPDEIMEPDEDVVPAFASGPSADTFESLVRARFAPAAPLSAPIATFAGFHDGVIRMRIYSPHGLTAEQRNGMLRSRGVLVPLTSSRARRVQHAIDVAAPKGSGVHVTTMLMRAFCVESKKLVPAGATSFAWGGRDVQAQFAPMRAVRRVAEVASKRGYLRPQGDAEAYGRFVTQYAIWSKLEHWDRSRFTEEFVKRTRETAQRSHKSWTNETEQTLRVLAPARWRDVSLVLRAAEITEARARVR